MENSKLVFRIPDFNGIQYDGSIYIDAHEYQAFITDIMLKMKESGGSYDAYTILGHLKDGFANSFKNRRESK